MMAEIIREMTAIKIINGITSEQVSAWARRVEAQRTHKALIKGTTECKDFNAIET